MTTSSEWTNPLRDARDKRLPRIAGPCGLTIFGVTGDLSRKKLMPAIYDLANRGLLPPGFALLIYGLSTAGGEGGFAKPSTIAWLVAGAVFMA